MDDDMTDSDHSSKRCHAGQQIAEYIMLVGVFSFILIAGVFVYFNFQETNNKSKSIILNSFDYKVALIEKQIELNRERMALLSSRTQLRKLLESLHLLDQRDKAEAKNKIKTILFDAQNSSQSINAIYIFDNNNNLVQTAGIKMDSDLIGDLLNEASIDGNKIDFMFLNKNRTYEGDLIVLKNLYQNNYKIGAVVMQVDFHSFLNQLGEKFSADSALNEHLFFSRNNNGKLQSIYIHERSLLEDKFSSFTPEQLINNRHKVIIQAKDNSMKNHFIVQQYFPEFGWYMLVAVSMSEVYGGFYSFLLKVLGVFIVYLGTLYWVSFVISRKISDETDEFLIKIEDIIRNPESKVKFPPNNFYLGITGDAVSRLVSKLQNEIETLLSDKEYVQKQYKKNSRLVQALEQKINETAMEAPSTHLANLRFFQKEYTRAWKQCGRYQTSLSIIYIELDYFKIFEEQLGQKGVDACLRSVLKVFNQHIDPDIDTLAEIHHDTFAILMPAGDIDNMRLIGNIIREEIENLAIYHPGSPIADYVTVSVGGKTIVPTSTASPSDFLSEVRASLESAKRLGHNRFIG
ncbi:MAG: hypothetical protein CMF48_04350 [Legionellales bacterium]|nr:hypothetical protein [Legionellales bacterium]|tara:strand:- start:706 stop:2427 length:1722 start_codon:yes stop_codon:yes gene_type:complete